MNKFFFPLILTCALAGGSAQAMTVVNVAATGTGQAITPFTLTLPARVTAENARFACGITQADLSTSLVLADNRWKVNEAAPVNTTAGEAVKIFTSIQSYSVDLTKNDTFNTTLWCQLQDSEGKAVSDLTPLQLNIHAVAKPIIKLSTATLNLGSCRPAHQEILTGQFTAITSNSGDYPVNRASLAASVTGGNGTADTVKIVDEQNNDIVQTAADITRTETGEHLLKVAIPCPSEPGSYSWQVTITHEIE